MSDKDISLTTVKKEAFETAWEKGWYEDEFVTFAERLALVHSEVSEALEEYRNWHKYNEIYVNIPAANDTSIQVQYDEEIHVLCKPEGIAVELADVLIRVCELSAFYGIDLERAVRIKLDYNKSRPKKHGGKRI